MRALVVDNNAIDCATLMGYLRHAGYSTTEASSVDQAREALEVQTFDLLLLETSLPDGDGFQLCNELRERLGDRMIIVFVSQRNTPIDRTIGIQLGADDYLGKPCNEEELLARIDARRRRRIDLGS